MAKARVEEDDDIQDYVTANPDALTIAYQSGYYDGKKAALAGRPWVGLTDEDIFAVIKKLQDIYHRPPIEIFARGIEQLLKEKNA